MAMVEPDGSPTKLDDLAGWSPAALRALCQISTLPVIQLT